MGNRSEKEGGCLGCLISDRDKTPCHMRCFHRAPIPFTHCLVPPTCYRNL